MSEHIPDWTKYCKKNGIAVDITGIGISILNIITQQKIPLDKIGDISAPDDDPNAYDKRSASKARETLRTFLSRFS